MIYLDFEFTKRFKKDFKRIKDDNIRSRIIVAIKKLDKMPDSGKPLRYGLKGHRRLAIGPFRIIYRRESNIIYLVGFEHRKHVYK